MIDTVYHDDIAVLTLRHGPVNALDVELLTALPEALAKTTGARGVVLTGSGRTFSAGVDLKRIVDGGPPYVASFLPALHRATLALYGHPGPVVAALNGHALAGGCVLAAACDLRLMCGGTIGLTELAAGVPFPTACLEVMRHAVGPALDRMVLAAGRLTPEEAASTGLVHEIVEPGLLLATALRRTEALGSTPPEVYALSKQQLHRPVLQRIAVAAPSEDPEVARIWSAERTTRTLRAYLTSLRRN